MIQRTTTLLKSLAQPLISKKFSKLNVKIDYCRGCENREQLELVEKDLYDSYRRTFGEHQIFIEANKSADYIGPFKVNVSIDGGKQTLVWDSRKDGTITEDNFQLVRESIESQIKTSKGDSK